MKVKRFDLYLLLIVFICFFFARSFITRGFPFTHDGEMHIARTANFYLALKDFQLPVRWAPGLNYRFGYPVFNFNYPGFYFLPVLFHIVGFDFEISMTFAVWAFYISGGLFLYLFLKHDMDKRIAFLTSVFWLSYPYFFLNFFIRGSFGEIMALSLFPFCLFFLKRSNIYSYRLNLLFLFLGTFLLSLSHNIFAMLLIPCLLGYSLFLYKKFRQAKPVLTMVLGLLATCFFWIPALLEKQYVSLLAFGKIFYQDHFVYPFQLFSSFWQYGFSVPGMEDTMPFTVGIPALIVISFALILLLRQIFTGRKPDKAVLLWLIGLLLVVFMATPYSLPLWKIIPVLSYLQFPWRLLGFAAIPLSFLFAVIMKNINRIRGRWLGLAVLFLPLALMVYTERFTAPFNTINNNDIYYLSYPFTTSTKNENSPVWFDQNVHLDFEHDFVFEHGEAEVLSRKSNSHIFKTENPTEKDLIFINRQAYFPGWKASVDGQETDIIYDLENYKGVMAVATPPGVHILKFKFTEDTPARIVGDTISVVSLMAMGIVVIKSNNKDKNG